MILGIMVHKIYIKVYATVSGKVTPMSRFRDYSLQTRKKTYTQSWNSGIHHRLSEAADPGKPGVIGVRVKELLYES